MSFDVDAFVTHWVYDIRQTLERELDSLKDDLRCVRKRFACGGDRYAFR
jgi:hypothetical protein